MNLFLERERRIMHSILVFSVLVFTTLQLPAQRPKRLLDEVRSLQRKYDTLYEPGKETYVFVGSSSIRTWDSLPKLFPHVQVVNSGFGGSMASDLLAFLEELVLDFRPDKVFIYEGDNDIYEKKGPAKIVRQTRRIVRRIIKYNGPTPITVIGAKPSPVRWHLKKKYENLNRKLKEYCETNPQVAYVHVWDAMLKQGHIDSEIYLEDGLHMNDQGYAIWERILKPLGN